MTEITENHENTIRRAAQVHPPLGRDGDPLGRQPHRRAGPRAALPLAAPLNADDIVAALEVARSNVSTSLKELQGWGIVSLVHVPGDKRDHFESMKDVWEMFRVVLDERKKRECDPTMRLLRDCIAEAEKDKATDEYTETYADGSDALVPGRRHQRRLIRPAGGRARARRARRR